MKINIITRHAVFNYGSLLQGIATVNIFERFGYEAEIIDYINRQENFFNEIIASSKKRNYKKIKSIVYIVPKMFDQLCRSIKLKRYKERYLKLSKKYSSLEELQTVDFKEEYLCSGSDQLWGYMPNYMGQGKEDPAYFLSFGSEKNRYFSFSASFGRTDFDEEYYRSLNKYLKKFSFITVREQSGVSLIEKYTPYKAEHVLDPTLMVESEFWHSFANKKIKERPYILLYQLRQNQEIDKYVKELARRKGLQVIRVTMCIYDIFRFGRAKILKDLNYVLSLFRDAQYVVSESFHATVFSLIFNRKFMDFLPNKTYVRIVDLLEMVKLSDRTATWTEKDFEIIDNEIDWQRVNAVLEEKRKESCEIVKHGLAALENEEE